MFRSVTIVCLVLICQTAAQGVEKTAEAPAQVTVNLLAMGDWGMNNVSQRVVGRTLAEYTNSSHRRFDGMLLLGDNFYVKLSGIDDPLWETMFEKMYDARALNFPFYAALGNHDYKNLEVEFEVGYSRQNPQSRWKMPAKWHRVELPADKPLVSVLVLDSNKDFLTAAEWQAELAWLEGELAKPRTTWIVCCAHHPLFSNGDHGDNGVLQNTWGALFKKYKVDFFLCGHDHDVQHLEVPGWSTSFMLAGGGGAKVRPMRVDKRGPFSKSVVGFADLSFTESEARCRLVAGEAGKILHEFMRSRDGEVKLTFTTPSDVATPRTPKSIARPDAEMPATTSATRAATKPVDAD